MHTRYRGMRQYLSTATLAFTKDQFLAVLPGTCGDKLGIAKQLDCSIAAVINALERPGWEDIKFAYEKEAQTAGDFFFGSLKFVAAQSWDLPSKLRASLAGLKAHRPEYVESSRVTVEGGRNPIRTQNQNLTVDLSMLKGLSVECQRELLAAIDREENPDSESPLSSVPLLNVPVVSGDNPQEDDDEQDPD